jgi:topoisomerase-4 subunit A
MVPKDPKYFYFTCNKTGKPSDYCAIASGRNHQKLKFDIDFASLAIKGRASKEFGFKYPIKKN